MNDTCRAVVGNYNCPVQLGNRMFVMLNAVLCSKIYNLPLVWEANVENAPFECDRFLTRQSVLRPASPSCLREKWPFPFTDWKTFRMSHSRLQKNALLTMRLPTPNGTLYCGRIERPVFSAAFAANPTLPPTIRQRILNLFSHGTYRAYGMAFHETFTFSNQSIDFVSDIGLHLRTNNPQVHFSKATTHLYRLMRKLQFPGCTILVSTDNLKKGTLFMRGIDAICSVHWLPRVVDRRSAVMSAHGNFKDLFIREMQHLSHARVVVSVAGSSASELVSSLSVANRNKAYSCTSKGCALLS